MDINWIQQRVQDGNYSISFTHTEKLRRRRISLEVIEEAIGSGQIIEAYPNDTRGASCLIFGYTKNNRPIHAVCGRVGDNDLLIVTAYEPDEEHWAHDWKTRKKGGTT